MLHVDENRLYRDLTWARAIETLRHAHATREMPFKHSELHADPGGCPNQFVNLTAWSAGRSICVKLVGVFPKNVTLPEPEPSIQGIVVLFDGKTGRAVMSCDGAAFTYRKTAADSALGSDLLARKDARVLCMLGAGGLAPHIVAAHRTVRPGIERVIVWNRTRARAEALAASLSASGIHAEVHGDPVSAVSEADIVSSATMTKTPLIAGAHLKAGAHVDLVGAYQPDMREADDEVLRRSGRLFVDTRVGCERTGEIGIPLANGTLRRESIVADYFDLCTGRHAGREDEDEITVCKNVGGGHLDLFIAEALYRTHAELQA